MMKILFAFLFLVSLNASSQNILKNANTITIKNVGFLEICNSLLDSGYNIENKDNDLQTVRTEKREYPKYWNATQVINVRLKDSVAFLSATFTAPPGGALFLNEPAINITNKKGETLPKSMQGYLFLILNNFALGFHKNVEYLKL